MFSDTFCRTKSQLAAHQPRVVWNVVEVVDSTRITAFSFYKVHTNALLSSLISECPVSMNTIRLIGCLLLPWWTSHASAFVHKRLPVDPPPLRCFCLSCCFQFFSFLFKLKVADAKGGTFRRPLRALTYEPVQGGPWGTWPTNTYKLAHFLLRAVGL